MSASTKTLNNECVMLDENLTEVAYTQLMESGPLFDTEEMEETEQAFVKWGFTRRMALGLLKNPGRKMYDLFQEDRDFAVTMVAGYDNIGNYSKMLREFADLMDQAHARMMLAYCNLADMDDVFKEGRE